MSTRLKGNVYSKNPIWKDMVKSRFKRLTDFFESHNLPETQSRQLVLLDTQNGVVAPLEDRHKQHLATIQLDKYEACAGLALKLVKQEISRAKGTVVARFIDHATETHQDFTFDNKVNLTQFLNNLGLYPQMTHNVPQASSLS